jgi:H+/Cl- antiporter ClcA
LNIQNRFALAVFKKICNSKLSIIIESIIIGFVAGLVIAVFRLALMRAAVFRYLWFAREHSMFVWLAALVVFAATGLLLGFALKERPNVRGSGVPHIKGVLFGVTSFNWKTEAPLKYAATLAALCAGLSLGRAGPCMQIGAYAGLAGAAFFHRRQTRERNLFLTSASAAGFSAAFSAPFSGVLFAIEELGLRLKPVSIVCVFGSALAAYFGTGLILGLNPVFEWNDAAPLPALFFPLAVLMGCVCAVAADLYKRLLYMFTSLYPTLNIPETARPALPVVLTLPLGVLFFNITGGGQELIESLAKDAYTIFALALMLAGKMLFTGICFGSGASGGLFLPLLACGSLTGLIFARVAEVFGILPEGFVMIFLILGMCAFFTAVVKAPITGIVLVLEITGGAQNLAALVLVSFSSLLTAELISSRPVYNVLLEKLAGLPVKSTDVKGDDYV